MKKLLQNWKKLCTVEGNVLAVSILTQVVIIICSIVEPVALSSFIECATIHSTALAVIWLFINLGLVIIEHISWHINYSNYTKLISPTYINLQSRITKATLVASKDMIDNTKLNYCINSDIFGIATFLDSLILRLASFVKFLVILIIIFVYSYTVGVMLVVMSAVGFSLLMMYNKLKRRSGIVLRENEISADKKTHEIIEMGEVVKKYNLENPMLLEQERRLVGYVNSYNNLYTKKSIKDNFIQIYWYTMLSVIFLVCYFEFNALAMSLAVFLILIDYSSTFVKLTENAFDFTIEITDLEEKVSRTYEILEFEKNSQKNENFQDTENSLVSDFDGNKTSGNIESVSQNFAKNGKKSPQSIQNSHNEEILKDKKTKRLKSFSEERADCLSFEVASESANNLQNKNTLQNIDSDEKNKLLTIESQKTFYLAGTGCKKMKLMPANVYIFQSDKSRMIFCEAGENNPKIEYGDIEYSSIYKIPELLLVKNQNEMFADSIIENLQIVKNDVELITAITESLGIDEMLNCLDDGDRKRADKIKDEKVIILLNIVRAILSDAEIVYFKMDAEVFDFGKNIIKTFCKFGKNKIVLVYDPAKMLSGKRGIFVE